MECLACGTQNSATAPVCQQCGESLRPARAQYHLDQAEREIAQGRYDQAVAQIGDADRQMLPLRQEQRDRYLLNARAFFLQAAIYYAHGQAEEARRELQQARENLAPLPHGQALYAEVLNRLGNTYYMTEDVAEALEHYQRAVPIAIANGLYLLATKALNNIANLYMTTGRRDLAREVFDQSAELTRQHSDPVALTIAYATLIRFHADDGLHPLALEYAARALAVYKKVPNLDTRSVALSDAITAYTYSGHVQQAEAHLRTLYELVHTSTNRVSRDMVGERIAELALQIGDPTAWYVTTLKELNVVSPRYQDSGHYAFQMAVYYVTVGDRDPIRRHLAWLKRTALDKEPGTELHRISALAHLYGALGQWAEAEAAYQTKLANPQLSLHERAHTLEQYARMMIQRNALEPSPEYLDRARAALSEAADIFTQMQSPLRIARVRAILDAAPFAALAPTSIIQRLASRSNFALDR